MIDKNLSEDELEWACAHFHPSSLEGAAFQELRRLRQGLQEWVCRPHRAGEEGEHSVGNPDCDRARRVLAGKEARNEQ